MNLRHHFWLVQGSWCGWCGSCFEGKFEEMNTNVSPVEIPFSAMAMSHQHDNTPIMQKLGASMSELGPVCNHTTSSPSSDPTSSHNDLVCGIMKILPTELTVSAYFLCPIFFISFFMACCLGNASDDRASLTFCNDHQLLVYLEKLSGTTRHSMRNFNWFGGGS